MNEFMFTTQYKDVEIKFHWSVLLTLGFGTYYQSHSLPAMISAFFGVLFMILLHELGHYYMARRYNYAVFGIVIHYLGGYCEHEETYYQYEDSMIAWGGVLAQSILLMASLTIGGLCSLLHIQLHNVLYSLLIGTFVYYNLFLIIFNLLPFPGFDGNSAWRIIRYLRNERPSHKTNRKKNIPKKKVISIKTKKPLTDQEVTLYADKFINDAIKQAKEKNDTK